MRKRQTGFTLVELIVVVIILGILAATAMPKFLNLQVQAKQAKLDAAYGTIRAASAIAHAAQLAAGGAQNAPVTLEGTTVTMCAGYPTPDLAGILAATQLSTATTNASGTHDYTRKETSVTGSWDSYIEIDEGLVTNTTCRVTYTLSAADCTTAVDIPTIAKSFTTCTL